MSRHNFDAPNSYADDLPWNAGEDAWGFGAMEPEWQRSPIPSSPSAPTSPPPPTVPVHFSRYPPPPPAQLTRSALADFTSRPARTSHDRAGEPSRTRLPYLTEPSPQEQSRSRPSHTTARVAYTQADRSNTLGQHSEPLNWGSPTDEASDEFFDLEDTSDEDDTPLSRAMPPSTRANSGRATVDLTDGGSSTSRQQRGTKRKAEASSSSEAGRPSKRRGSTKKEDVEEIDLANEAPSAEEELLQQQRQDAIKSQQAADGKGPQKLGKRQCIICLDSITNCTTTACGHFYCHECLVSALNSSERNSDRGVGTCPNCRKPLPRNKRTNNIIPIQFMKKTQFEKNQRKRVDIHGYR